MKYETHYHDTFGCFPVTVIVIVLFLVFGFMTISDSMKIVTEEKQKTERAEKFFDTMIEVEEIRSDRDKTVAKYEMIADIKSSWPNTANKIINVLIGFSIVSFIILFIFGWVTHKRNKERGIYEN